MAGNAARHAATPDALTTLSRLRAVAFEAAVAHESLSKLNRSAALNRALGELIRLLNDVGSLLAP